MTLTAFTEKDADRLFVPFSDLTSGTETYAAGRFLDLNRTATNLYELDFNRPTRRAATTTPSFGCPYPPPENRLKSRFTRESARNKPDRDQGRSSSTSTASWPTANRCISARFATCWPRTACAH